MQDLGNLKNNYKFYEGFEGEGEGEIVLFFEKNKEYNIHIWDGYIDDIFANAPLNQKTWTGFTRDYQEDIGAFADMQEHKIDTTEYLNDIKAYLSYPLSKKCIEVCYLIIDFLEFALANNYDVILYVS